MDVGSRVLHYEIERRLGGGGMGEVFLAHDTRLHRRVAIKVLKTPTDEHARKRVLHEARAAAALDHPDICAIYDVASHPQLGDFIVMQYVEGETLAAHLRRQRLPADRALEVAERIAGALAAAHARGLVHRDLKPQNVIITPGGDLKLLDFGVAKLLPDSAAAAAAPTVSEWTGEGRVVGTPGYMSPEQVRGLSPDARTDLFSLGCVLYECLTSRPAFQGATAADMAAHVLQLDPPPPSRVVAGLTPGHDAICARLLQKSAERRYASASDAATAMRELRQGATTSRGPDTISPRRIRRLVIAAAVTAGAIAAAVMWLRPRLPEPTPDAVRWYATGVDAIRDGRYVAAKSSLLEAVNRFPDYPQAYSRLAEAHSELDEESSAKTALLKVDELVRRAGAVGDDDQLRIDAIRSFVLRDYAASIARYTRLAERAPDDPGRWVDVARAEEAAAQIGAASTHYQQAIALDKDFAAAHLRLASLRGTGGRLSDALVSLDEAIRLYRARGQTEGESEALLRKGILLTAVGRFEDSRVALGRVLEMTTDKTLLHQRVRALFDMGRLTAASGAVREGEIIGRDAVQAAVDAGLWGHAALGQIDLANTIFASGDLPRADAEIARAIALAVEHGARKTEIRARLVQASMRVQRRKPEEAIALLDAPLKTITAQQFKRFEADAKTVLSRAHEQLEHYAIASALASEVLAFAESTGDQLQTATTLDLVASQLGKQGRLTDALTTRERREQITRKLKNDAALTYDLPNRAELLIRLGRGADAETLLEEFDGKAQAGLDVYVSRRWRVASLRAFRAATEGRFQDVLRFVDESGRLGGRSESATVFDHGLAEYARAMLGLRPASPAPAAEPAPNVGSVDARELCYWRALTALARRDPARALMLAHAAWSAAGAQDNAEVRWRLAAVAAIASTTRPAAPGVDSATMRAHATDDATRLTAAWERAATIYFARHDLATLRKRLW